jgi:uncharacterized membrane protein YbhN (UPF0104 family)
LLVFWLIVRFITRNSGAQPLLSLEPRWALAALCALTLQVLIVAQRWSFFSRELGVQLSYGAALGAYYVSIFLNQVLPLGVLGDAARGAWHARRVTAAQRATEPGLAAATALILDRLSGQLLLCALVLAVLPWWWSPVRANVRAFDCSRAWLLIVCSLLAVAGLAALLSRVRRSALRRTAQARRAFLRPRAFAVHEAYSAAALLAHALAFFCAARALGFGLPPGVALRVVPLVLAASAVPSFALGTGAREAAAALLYHLLGLRAAEGAVIALGLGVLGFVASLPALLILPYLLRESALRLGRQVR